MISTQASIFHVQYQKQTYVQNLIRAMSMTSLKTDVSFGQSWIFNKCVACDQGYQDITWMLNFAFIHAVLFKQ